MARMATGHCHIWARAKFCVKKSVKLKMCIVKRMDLGILC